MGKPMNYEEMLNAREGVATNQVKLPFGDFYRKRIEKKYRYVVELSPSLYDNIVFCEALRREHEWAMRQSDSHQLHYDLHADSGGIYEMELEAGNYQTLAQLLESSPASVAVRGFVDSIVAQLMDYVINLHANQVYHLCFAPQNVFVRKGDNQPLLLCHGSFYLKLSSLEDIYAGFDEYVAPEVLAHGEVDERSDVYSLGKLIAFLFSQGSMPYEYRQVVKKATAQDLEKRYKSVEEMKSALTQKRASRRSLTMLVAAVGIALLCMGIYVELMPQASTVEFVEPAPVSKTADPLDEPYDLGFMMDGDSLAMTEEDLKYQQKAEEIYRKHFTRKANAIMDKVYNNERMNASEKSFLANSQAMAEELMNLQKELAEEAGLSEEQAGRIAQEIVEGLSAEKQKQLTRKGYIKSGEESAGE